MEKELDKMNKIVLIGAGSANFGLAQLETYLNQKFLKDQQYHFMILILKL